MQAQSVTVILSKTVAAAILLASTASCACAVAAIVMIARSPNQIEDRQYEDHRLILGLQNQVDGLIKLQKLQERVAPGGVK